MIATLDGLEKNSAGRPGNPPLYLHVSGCGIISDNSRGEKVENPKFWTDIALDLNEYVPLRVRFALCLNLWRSCEPTNTHLESDKPVCIGIGSECL